MPQSRAEINRRYYAKNRDAILARNRLRPRKVYPPRNAEHALLIKERRKQTCKKYYMKNRDAILERNRSTARKVYNRLRARTKEGRELKAAAAKRYRTKNKEVIAKRKKQRRERKKYDTKYVRRRALLTAKANRLKRERKKGFLYFFRSVTPGFYKVGCTKNWEKRKLQYGGPSTIDHLFFLRPVNDMFYAESMMKIFVAGIGYTRWNASKKKPGDWFVKEDELTFKPTSGTLSSRSHTENASE